MKAICISCGKPFERFGKSHKQCIDCTNKHQQESRENSKGKPMDKYCITSLLGNSFAKKRSVYKTDNK